MSKNVAVAQSVKVSDVHWFAEHNSARYKQPYLTAGIKRKDGSVKGGVFESLMERGWATELPCQVMPLPCSGVTADDAVKERKQTVEACEKVGNLELAAVYKAMWCTPDGGYIKPKYAANSGFTRGLSLGFVLLAASKQHDLDGTKFSVGDFEISVVVKVFANEVERLQEQAFENVSRTMSGVTDMGWPDILKSGHALLVAAGKDACQRTLRKAFGDGTGQKAYAILAADAKYPELNLVERISKSRPKDFDRLVDYSPDGYIPATSIPQNASALQNAVTAVDAEMWLKEKVFGKSGNEPKVMSKKQWDALYVVHKVQKGSPMGEIIDAHIAGHGIDKVLIKWPQLTLANCVCSIAIDTEPVAKAPTAKAPTAKAKK